MTKLCGPGLSLRVSCSDCEYSSTERYTCQGDSGRDWSCAQPGVMLDNVEGKFGPRYVGQTSQTPVWCPYYPSNIQRLVDRQNSNGNLAGDNFPPRTAPKSGETP